MKVKYI